MFKRGLIATIIFLVLLFLYSKPNSPLRVAAPSVPKEEKAGKTCMEKCMAEGEEEDTCLEECVQYAGMPPAPRLCINPLAR